MLRYLFIVLAVLALDIGTKQLAMRLLSPLGSVPIIEGAFHLTYVENTGAAFGMLKDSRWVFLSVSTIAIAALILYIIKYGRESVFVSVCLSMILGGGIGNMIDRVALGYVVDFIDFCLINFAVFNIADSFVCVGSFLLIIYLVREIIRDARKKDGDRDGGKDGDNESNDDGVEMIAGDGTESGSDGAENKK